MSNVQMFATNVQAKMVLLYGVLEVSWRPPAHPDFEEVAVYRKVNDFASSELDPYATLVYQGKATKIYDYQLSGGATADLKEAAAHSIGVYNPSKDIFEGQTNQPLDPNIMYYYTVFSIDKNGNYYASAVTTSTAKPNRNHGLADLMYHQYIPAFYRQEDKKHQLKRYLQAVAMMYDFVYTSIDNLQDLVSVDKCPPDKLDYLAYQIDWEIDKTLPIPSQRQTLKNAINIYRNAGTKKGLDTLVKVYSGFPNTSGVSEGIESSMYTVYFGYFPEDIVRYDYASVPDLDSLDPSTIGKGGDTLKYIFDSRPNTRQASDKFIAYVQKTTPISAEQEATMRRRLDRLLSRFTPAGVKYEIEIY